jgi:N-acetylglucosaminyl-diphospho-decaprenol L-rhamnosyltransferase
VTESHRPGDVETSTPSGDTDLRVVVVTYSSGLHLAGFLDSLAKATTRPYEVVLADNGSTDGSPERAVADWGNVRLVRTGGNIGYGAAANVGARGVTQKWLLIANPDVIWDPGALDVLLAAGERWPRAAALGPGIRTPTNDLYPSARGFPSLGRGIAHALLGWVWPSNPWTASYRRERDAADERAIDGWLSGSCLLLRREAFESVGGFDQTYFMYFEDTDLCERLLRAGWQIVYVPSAQVTHEGGHATETRRGRSPVMLRAHHRSAYRYLARKYSGRRWAPVRVLLAVGLFGRYVVARAVPQIGAGAKPTRSADVLPG